MNEHREALDEIMRAEMGDFEEQKILTFSKRINDSVIKAFKKMSGRFSIEVEEYVLDFLNSAHDFISTIVLERNNLKERLSIAQKRLDELEAELKHANLCLSFRPKQVPQMIGTTASPSVTSDRIYINVPTTGTGTTPWGEYTVFCDNGNSLVYGTSTGTTDTRGIFNENSGPKTKA